MFLHLFLKICRYWLNGCDLKFQETLNASVRAVYNFFLKRINTFVRNWVYLNTSETIFRWKWMLRAHVQWGIYCQRCYLDSRIISTSLFTINSSPVPLKKAMAFISFHGEWAACYLDGIEFFPMHQFFLSNYEIFKMPEKRSFIQYVKRVLNGLDELFSKIKMFPINSLFPDFFLLL